jgi:hypothetical protein
MSAFRGVTTRSQIRLVADAAKNMNLYSKNLNIKAVELEGIGSRYAEAVSGLLARKKIQDTDPEFLPSLRQLIRAISIGIEYTNVLINTHNDGYGVSQVMNRAIDLRVAALKKVRYVHEAICTACTDGINSFDTAVLGKQLEGQ